MSSPGTQRRRSGRSRTDLPMNADINVTSLVDVAFTLLVIFIITAPILQGGIEVAVPRADVDPITSEQDPLFVTVMRDGSVYVEEALADNENLESSIRQLLATGAFEKVFIRGDSIAPYGPVLKAMSAAVDAGCSVGGCRRALGGRRPVRKGRNAPDRRSLVLSASLHATVLALVWSSVLFEPEPIFFESYEIEMVSPPPAVQEEEMQEAAEELVVERPEPEPLPPEPEPEEIIPAEQQEEDPPPVEEIETPAEEPPDQEEEPVVAAAPEEVEEATEESGVGIEVRMEGLRRDFPEYYGNIIFQIQRCLRTRDSGARRTSVQFWINRDGSISGLDLVERSGNTRFDIEAMGAVECAGRGRFGPLPEELPFERFPILFHFEPRGGLDLLLNDGGFTPERTTNG